MRGSSGFTNDVTIAVWVGHDNADGKRRTLGRGQTGAKVAAPIFQVILEAAWAHHAPKAPLSPPSPQAAKQLIAMPIDLNTGDRLTDGQKGLHGIFPARTGSGASTETQFRLVPQSEVYAFRNPDPWSDGEERGGPITMRTARTPKGPAGSTACARRSTRTPQARTRRGFRWWWEDERSPQAPAHRSGLPLGQRTGLLMALQIFVRRAPDRRCSTFWPAAGGSAADEFRIEEVPSVTAVAPAKLKPRTIVFSDHRDDKLTDAGTGLIRFEDWARERPVQKQFLSLFPGYPEPTIKVSVHGITKPYTEKLHMYVVEARFLIAKAPGCRRPCPLSRASTCWRRSIPRSSTAASRPSRLRRIPIPQSAHNRHPDRRWCEAPGSLCIESRYPLEGKLPVGIRLANKLEEGGKKISEFMEFQSEIRVLPPEDIDQCRSAEADRARDPVAGVLEQTIFSVNQVMQFGKLLAILQEHPADPNKTVATVFMALAVETDVLERKKEFENVPVLRNLIPAQVLMGKSSFNSGNSISAGLPDYVRNRIRAIADLFEQ